jgi:hypothetical protein
LQRNALLFAAETEFSKEYEYVFIAFIDIGNLKCLGKDAIVEICRGSSREENLSNDQNAYIVGRGRRRHDAHGCPDDAIGCCAYLGGEDCDTRQRR